jgi:hypothetical protein
MVLLPDLLNFGHRSGGVGAPISISVLLVALVLDGRRVVGCVHSRGIDYGAPVAPLWSAIVVGGHESTTGIPSLGALPSVAPVVP